MKDWTLQAKLRAQTITLWSSFLFSITGAMTGSTILFLSANYIGVPETIIAMMNTLGYFSYLALPPGYFLLKHLGVRNLIALTRLVALGCIILMLVSVYFRSIGVWLLPLAALISSLSSCTGAATSFPLQKFLTNDENCDAYLTRSNLYTYSCSLLCSLGAYALFHFLECNPRTLTIAYTIGILTLITSLPVLFMMPEPEEVKNNASVPLLSSLPKVIKMKGVVAMCLSGIASNLILMTMTPACLLACKKGCCLDDDAIVVLTTCQTLGGILVAKLYQRLIKAVKVYYLGVLIGPLAACIVLFWLIAPPTAPLYVYSIPFFLLSLTLFCASLTCVHYALTLIPSEYQTPGSFLTLMTHGTLAGFIGMGFNALLFKVLWLIPSEKPLFHYQLFLVCCLLLCLASFCINRRLPKRS